MGTRTQRSMAENVRLWLLATAAIVSAIAGALTVLLAILG
jgi:hypothetical protein